MKKIYDSGALHMLQTENGIFFVAFQGEYADKAIVMYKHWDADTGKITPITRNVYLLAKFGNSFEQFDENPSDFLNSRTVFLPDHHVLIMHPSGEAAIINNAGTSSWHGKMLYKDHGPFSATISGRSLWASFPVGNALVRYNIRGMREDLRIGSENSSVLKTPEGLWSLDENRMLVCTGKSNKILNVNLNSYIIEDFYSFNEPVHQYIKILHHEVVLLDSGIYYM